ncbi:MAG: zinc ribbon domain-containing protein [Anaerolineaceae bacterium]|nr:zinc ribbon domain-containing protein [Anaerolineaceae bacterium]
MAIGSILVGLALLMLVGIFIARPFLRPQDRPAALTEQELLLAEKEALLDQIQALDFDHETGKLPTEVHALQRERLVEQATAVLQAIDAAGSAPTHIPDKVEDAPPVDVDTDIEIEAAIARLRQQRSQEPAAPAAAAAAPLNNGHTRFCPQCGTPTDPGDRFCAHCGHNLTLTTSTKTA